MRVLWAGCVRVCEFRLLAEKLLTVYMQGLRESHRNFSRPLISGDPFIFKKIVVLAARSRADVTPAPTSAPSGASRAFPGPGAAQGVHPRCSSPPLRAPRHCPCKVPALGQSPDVMSAWTCLRVPNPGAGIELDWARRPHADCGDVSTAPASTFLRRLGPLGKSDCWDGRARGSGHWAGPHG